MSAHSCLLDCFAYVLDVPATELVAKLGHDGSEVLWPELKYPYNVRGFNVFELIDLSLSNYQVCTYLPREVKSKNQFSQEPKTICLDLTTKYIDCGMRSIVMTNSHAVVCHNSLIDYNPGSHKITYSDLRRSHVAIIVF